MRRGTGLWILSKWPLRATMQNSGGLMAGEELGSDPGCQAGEGRRPGHGPGKRSEAAQRSHRPGLSVHRRSRHGEGCCIHLPSRGRIGRPGPCLRDLSLGHPTERRRGLSAVPKEAPPQTRRSPAAGEPDGAVPRAGPLRRRTALRGAGDRRVLLSGAFRQARDCRGVPRCRPGSRVGARSPFPERIGPPHLPTSPAKCPHPRHCRPRGVPQWHRGIQAWADASRRRVLKVGPFLDARHRPQLIPGMVKTPVPSILCSMLPIWHPQRTLRESYGR